MTSKIRTHGFDDKRELESYMTELDDDSAVNDTPTPAEEPQPQAGDQGNRDAIALLREQLKDLENQVSMSAQRLQHQGNDDTYPAASIISKGIAFVVLAGVARRFARHPMTSAVLIAATTLIWDNRFATTAGNDHRH